MPLISLRSPIKISLMVKVAKRKPLRNEGKPQKLALLDRGQSKKGDSLSSYPVERRAAAKIPNLYLLDGSSSCPAREMMFDKMDSFVKERKCNGGK